MKTDSIAIIGAGPSGTAAAIQLKRYGFDSIILEKGELGGLLRNANLIENYPGFPDGISGPRLVALFQSQLERASIKIFSERVSSLAFEGKRFVLKSDKRILHPQIVVVASGTKPIEFLAFNIPDKAKNRVYYEIAPILEAEGKQIAVVGAGDAAFDYALNLSRNNQVTILNRKKTIDCLPLLWQRASFLKAISYYENTEILGITDLPSGDICIECMRQGEISTIQTHYLVFAIGREPRLDFMSDQLKDRVKDLEQEGLIYFVGDVKNGDFRQTAIAIGDGLMAAMKIYSRRSIFYN